MTRWTAIFPMCLLIAPPTAARPQADARIGDTYEIGTNRESRSSASDGSSGSSTDRDTIIARVVGLRSDGIDLEYDLPANATKQARAGNWQFPARVFRPVRGPLRLLNASELAARVDGWLAKAKLTRAACGRWIFTWNAFRIDCDPQSVIALLDPIEQAPDDLRDGGIYKDAAAREPAQWTRTATGSFVASAAIDPEAVRRERAESDVVVGEIGGKPVSLDTALRTRSGEQISGTTTVTFDVDAGGQIRRRTRVTQTRITEPGGRIENRTVTESVDRRLLPRAGS